MNNLFLREQDKNVLLQLLNKHLPDISVWVYGSRINGTAHDISDLDILLRSKDLTPINIIALENFIQALKNSNIPILVDAKDWARLPLIFHQKF